VAAIVSAGDVAALEAHLSALCQAN
jgi:hypothetical protein